MSVCNQVTNNFSQVPANTVKCLPETIQLNQPITVFTILIA